MVFAFIRTENSTPENTIWMTKSTFEMLANCESNRRLNFRAGLLRYEGLADYSVGTRLSLQEQRLFGHSREDVMTCQDMLLGRQDVGSQGITSC